MTLKLLTYASTGAFVAAATTSLPERMGGTQNWDYRYTWVRDTSLFINTLFRLGYSGEAKAFIDFILHRCGEEYENESPSKKTKALKVLYPVQDGTSTKEIFLTTLEVMADPYLCESATGQRASFSSIIMVICWRPFITFVILTEESTREQENLSIDW